MIVKSSRYEVRLKDEPFAKGGEGCIYDVVGDNELVAKIYHPAGRTSSRYEKIKVMLEHPPKETARSQTAWPVDVLYDTAGSFIGFLMPRIKKVTKIDILYSYDNRGRHPWDGIFRRRKTFAPPFVRYIRADTASGI
jgi:DNA-binding helix-hairpin-helix protein with protein kinase domain